MMRIGKWMASGLAAALLCATAAAADERDAVKQTMEAYEQAWSRHDAQTALASGIAVRYRADGSTLERVAVTYELWHTDKGWKIFLSATHAPETVLQFR